jgi:hypothetical protein
MTAAMSFWSLLIFLEFLAAVNTDCGWKASCIVADGLLDAKVKVRVARGWKSLSADMTGRMQVFEPLGMGDEFCVISILMRKTL